jgi:Subtilase family
MPQRIHQFRGTSVTELDVLAFRRSALTQSLLTMLEPLQPQALAMLSAPRLEAQAVEMEAEPATFSTMEETVEEDGTITLTSVTKSGKPKPTTRQFATELTLTEATLQPPNPAQAEVAAFLNAGWLFAPVHEVKEGLELSHRTYRYVEGQVTIGLNRLVVRFTRQLTRDELQKLVEPMGLDVTGELALAAGLPSIFTVAVPSGRAFEKAIHLRELSDLEYAEPDMIEHLPVRSHDSAADGTGDRSWHTEMMQAKDAWTLTRGKDVIVGILDHGFCLSHRRFKSAVSPKSGWLRYTCGDKVLVSTDMRFMPFGQHGTFCAGVAVGRGLADEGWQGVAPEAKVLAVACGEEVESQYMLAQGLAYLAQDAHVISCSLGPKDSPFKLAASLRSALQSAARSRGGLGVAVFWAVANGSGSIVDDQVCNSGLVIPIAASDRHDQPHGAHGSALAFLAPGVQLYGPLVGGQLTQDAGTSFAAPCAAAVAGLMVALDPDLPVVRLRELMEQSCDKVGSDAGDSTLRQNDYVGHGRINAGRAAFAAQGEWIVESVYRKVKGRSSYDRSSS